MAKTKVKFEITLEVDVEGWCSEYGFETKREVQRDVKQYLRSLILGSDEGGLGLMTEAS